MPIPAPITLSSDKPKEKTYNFAHGKAVDLTPEALNKVKEFMAKNREQLSGKNFRVFVEGGGCSGFQYGFTFDEKKPEDLTVLCGDVAVLVNEASLTYLKGSVIDYVEDFRGSGYIVKNPLSKGECGCGLSFTV